MAAKKPLPRPVPVANDALTRALAKGHLTPAAYALERARWAELFTAETMADQTVALYRRLLSGTAWP